MRRLSFPAMPVRSARDATENFDALRRELDAARLHFTQDALNFPGGTKTTETKTLTFSQFTTVSVVSLISLNLATALSLVEVSGNQVKLRGYDFITAEEPAAGTKAVFVIWVKDHQPEG